MFRKQHYVTISKSCTRYDAVLKKGIDDVILMHPNFFIEVMSYSRDGRRDVKHLVSNNGNVFLGMHVSIICLI